MFYKGIALSMAAIAGYFGSLNGFDYDQTSILIMLLAMSVLSYLVLGDAD